MQNPETPKHDSAVQAGGNGHGGVHVHPAPDRLHPQVHLQHRPQGDRAAVLLPGADLGVRRHVPVAADAHSPGVAGGEGAGLRHQAGDLPGAAHHARHHHGVLRADHGAAGRVRQLHSAHPDRRARHGVPHPEHAVVLDDVPGVPGDYRRVHCGRRGADFGLDQLRAAERDSLRRAGTRAWAKTCGSSASRCSASLPCWAR